MSGGAAVLIGGICNACDPLDMLRITLRIHHGDTEQLQPKVKSVTSKEHPVSALLLLALHFQP
jgi:hypothetical protein